MQSTGIVKRRSFAAGIVVVAALAGTAPEVTPTIRAQSPAFDLDTGNAPLEVIIPAVRPVLAGFVSPGANDASLVLRIIALSTNGWFDALAPYHPTAVGVHSRLGRRPPHERTRRNKNIAIVYANYRVFNSVLPLHRANWRAMMISAGLDPDDAQENTKTPIGIGNLAGNAVVAARERDGMNQLGDEGGRTYNLQPYADYLGYKPVNTAYELVDPTRWQPNFTTTGNGLFRIQQFVTPQYGVTQPYSYASGHQFQAPPPLKSMDPASAAYRAQADEVLAMSAGLTDHQKMTAEFFDNKLRALGGSVLHVTAVRGFDMDEFVIYDFLTNMAAFDGGIAAWNQKLQYDAVRPFSAIRYLYGDSHVTAWGGPGKGTVTDLPASQWRSYLPTADHPEYPSGSGCFCAAHAQASRRFLGSNDLGMSVKIPRGSSGIEPGVTPAADIVLGPWHTWDDFENECAISRMWGGVHFRDAVEEGLALCRQIGDAAFEFLQAHINGTANKKN